MGILRTTLPKDYGINGFLPKGYPSNYSVSFWFLQLPIPYEGFLFFRFFFLEKSFAEQEEKEM